MNILKVILVLILFYPNLTHADSRLYRDIHSDNQYWETSGEGTLEDPYRIVNDVALQDQITRAILIPFHQIYKRTTIATKLVADTKTIEVVDGSTVVTGDLMILFDVTGFSQYNVVSVSTNTITVDSLIDVEFDVGSTVDFAKSNLGVNGAVTPQIYGIRGQEVGEPIDAYLDITRVMFVMQTSTAVDLSKFGDLTALTNGLLLRHRNGNTYNVFNIKTNGDLASLCYDWTPYAASNPVQGQNGFVARLTFAGQNKIGVVLRVGPNEDVEFIVQDDLSGVLDFKIIAEGHIVD